MFGVEEWKVTRSSPTPWVYTYPFVKLLFYEA